eukprot:353643-Chlamydomonas_euryale.AAC.1
MPLPTPPPLHSPFSPHLEVGVQHVHRVQVRHCLGYVERCIKDGLVLEALWAVERRGVERVAQAPAVAKLQHQPHFEAVHRRSSARLRCCRRRRRRRRAALPDVRRAHQRGGARLNEHDAAGRLRLRDRRVAQRFDRVGVRRHDVGVHQRRRDGSLHNGHLLALLRARHVGRQQHRLDRDLGAAPQPLVHLAERALPEHLEHVNLLRLCEALHAVLVELLPNVLDARQRLVFALGPRTWAARRKALNQVVLTHQHHVHARLFFLQLVSRLCQLAVDQHHLVQQQALLLQRHHHHEHHQRKHERNDDDGSDHRPLPARLPAALGRHRQRPHVVLHRKAVRHAVFDRQTQPGPALSKHKRRRVRVRAGAREHVQVATVCKRVEHRGGARDEPLHRDDSCHKAPELCARVGVVHKLERQLGRQRIVVAKRLVRVDAGDEDRPARDAPQLVGADKHQWARQHEAPQLDRRNRARPQSRRIEDVDADMAAVADRPRAGELLTHDAPRAVLQVLDGSLGQRLEQAFSDCVELRRECLPAGRLLDERIHCRQRRKRLQAKGRRLPERT